jgi:hypothetical protein
MMRKWLWRGLNEKEALWFKIIKNRYDAVCHGFNYNPEVIGTLRAPWRSIAKVWPDIVKYSNMKLVVGIKSDSRKTIGLEVPS